MKEIICMCEKKFKADIPDVVDLEKNPEALSAIIEGTFMNVTCPSCKKVLKPEFPFTILHKGKGWEISFAPELQRQKSIKTLAGIARRKGYSRLVIGYPELLEKIKILEETLDDRVIEYLKYIILSKVLEKVETDEKDIFIYYNEKVGNELIFHIEGLKRDEVGIFKVPFSTYTKAVPEIEKRMGEEPFNEFLTPPYVSLNRLYSLLDL